MALLCALFEGLDRLAPGSAAATKRALGLIDSLPSRPAIVDLGCGAGVASLVLAEATEGTVAAVDIHPPFLLRLATNAAARGLGGRIHPVAADIAKPPFRDQAFDLIWSEGALYTIGFEAGLGVVRHLVRPDGWIAVSELTWLTDTPAAEAERVMANEYPAMTTVQRNLEFVQDAGFAPAGHFMLPGTAWTDDYYGPVRERLATFRAAHANDADAQAVADAMQAEIDLYDRYGDSYGYVFIVARAA